MSRSFRNPRQSNGGESEKRCKRTNNRCLRVAVRQKLKSAVDLDAICLPEMRDVSNPYSMNKDGKHYSHRLELYLHTLGKCVRVRDGRHRLYHVLTTATLDHEKSELVKFELCYDHDLFSYDAANVEREALRSTRGLRK